MTVLSEVEVYRNNPLMNANLVYLGFVLLILGLFQCIFVGGFFKTAYRFARPFVTFIVAAFLVVGLGEALFHIADMCSSAWNGDIFFAYFALYAEDHA